MSRKTYDIGATIGSTDYVDADGNIQRDKNQVSVLVRDETDLALLTDYAVGTIAYTAGFADIWQLGADGEWTEV